MYTYKTHTHIDNINIYKPCLLSWYIWKLVICREWQEPQDLKTKKQTLKRLLGLASKDVFFVVSLFFCLFLVLKCKHQTKHCVFLFSVIFSNHKPSKKSKKLKLIFVFAFQNQKNQKNTRKTKKTSFEAKPKRIFKVLFFVFLFWGFAVIVILYILQAFRKVAIFIENSFQERDHIKQYVCNLQEFWYVVLML